jgi:ABC-type oligopeptide transport system ATPase subunit
MSASPPLLAVEGLRMTYLDRRGQPVEAVRGVSLEVRPGEVLGVVGESGSGKTTLGRCVMRLMEPTAGRIMLGGEDFRALGGGALKAARRKMQMVFQDPFGSLNPRHRVGEIVGEPLVVHGEGGVAARVAELLDRVGLPAEAAGRYPHEFSGGQRQRIAIARALALRPNLILADEPVSALDVSIQSQIINLIADLKAELGLAMIFISHDLSVVRHVSDRVAVMRHGVFVETGRTEDVFAAPQHDYTWSLLAAMPKLRSRGGLRA